MRVPKYHNTKNVKKSSCRTAQVAFFGKRKNGEGAKWQDLHL